MSPLCCALLATVIFFAAGVRSYSYNQPNEYGYSSPYQQQEQRVDQLKMINKQVCPRFEEYRNQFIIDIKASLARGAKLIGAVTTEGVVECVSNCCNNPSCDLSLFRVNGDSATGHNCYRIRCGNPANCVMAYHQDFVSIMFESAVASSEDNAIGIGREHSPVTSDAEDQSGRGSVVNSDIAATSTSSAATIPHAVIHSTKVDINPDSQSKIISTSANSVAAVHSSSRPAPSAEVTTMNNNHYEHTTTVTDKTGAVTATEGNSKQQLATTTTVDPGYHHDDEHLPPRRSECDVHGCKGGSGLIVVGVVGCVAFLVVFFVGLIIARRLYYNRQKKHYHNVDYLINGMYT